MSACKHSNLALLPQTVQRLRCRQCNLTIKADELEFDYCPECFEVSGKKRYDFEPVKSVPKTQYRCESCGAIIEYNINNHKRERHDA